MTLLATIPLPNQQVVDHLRSNFYRAFSELVLDKNYASVVTSKFSDFARKLAKETVDLGVSFRIFERDRQSFISITFCFSQFVSGGESLIRSGLFGMPVQSEDGWALEVLYRIDKIILADSDADNIRDRLTAKTNRQLVEDLNIKNQQLQSEVEERKAAEETLRDTQKELIATEKLAALGGLVAGIAHEINTPVGIGVTAASHLSDSLKNFDAIYRSGEMRRSDLEGFLKSVSDLNAMVEENLLRASRLIKSFKEVAVDQTAEDEREFNLRGYAEQVVMSLSPRLRATSIQVVLNGIDPELTIKTTPGPIAQILTNLVMNSLIHGFDADRSGQIIISARRRSADLELSYTDTGKGISRENLGRIFEPFFTTKRSHGGSGLGMHLVYNIVTKKYSGKIKCSSELGRGVVFEMTFPNLF